MERVTAIDVEKVIEALEERRIKSGGHRCYTAIDLSQNLKLDFNKVKLILNELYKRKKIIVSDTIHGKGVRLKD